MLSRPLNVLILGKDPSLFRASDGSAHMGDARARHAYYARRLDNRHPGSELRILTYTKIGSGKTVDASSQGLKLWGTASRHRVLFMLDLLRRLPDVLDDGWRPDVVTVQTPWEEGVIGWLLARALGARFVPQLHFDLFSPDWLAEHPLNAWRRYVAKFILRRADRVRVVSTPLRQLVAANCGIPISRIDVAPVGVNFVAASGERRACKSAISDRIADRQIVLFVGRLYAPKNLALWIGVAGRVAACLPEVCFAVVGDGPDESRTRQLAAEAGIAERILFLGRRTHAELPNIYAASDVFLLTSHYEGFGRVVLEAQLAGIPVVSTACGGPEDLIKDGCSGRLLPPGDEVGLVAAVTELLRDPAQAARLGSAGRAQAEQNFSLEVLTDRMIDVWEAA
jgi:phosphatidylinositol alpha 1,6-mannosyltransferase